MFLQAWVGHPYYDVIDNTTEFEAKVVRMIAVSVTNLGCIFTDVLENLNCQKLIGTPL